MSIVSTISAKVYDIPLVLSYHTHLPVYAERYRPPFPSSLYRSSPRPSLILTLLPN